MNGFKGTISSSSPPDPALLQITSATLGIKAIYSAFWVTVQADPIKALQHLDNYWGARGQSAAFERATGYYVALLNAQIEHIKQRGAIRAEAAQRLTALLSDSSGAEVHGITVTQGDGRGVKLHGAYVLGRPIPAVSESTPYDPQYFVWLWTPGKGIEQFPTLGWMSDTLLRRFGSRDKAAAVLEYPVITEAVEQQTATLSFDPVHVRLADRLVADLVSYQRAVLGNAVADGAEPELESACRLAALNEGFEAHLRDLLQQYHLRTLPEWLRLASADERTAYRDRETALSMAQQTYDSQFKGFATTQAYAKQQVSDFFTSQMSIELDPEASTVQTHFQWVRRGTKTTVTQQMTLVAFALQELTAPHLQLTVGPELQARGVTSEQLWAMHGQLNLRQRYYTALKQHYRQPSTLQHLADVLSLRLALTLLAARYQGHAEASLLDPVESARAAPIKPFAAGVQVGKVYVHRRKIALRDLLVFGVGEGASQRLMLYAPGSPAGRDIFVFDSRRQMDIELSSWVLTETGRHYLTAQVPVVHRARTQDGLGKLSRRPGGGFLPSLVVQWLEDSSFSEAMLQYARAKAGIHLDEYDDLTPAWYRNTDPETRLTLAVLDKRLAWMRKVFAHSSQHQAFSTFARQDIQARLDALVERHGVARRHDCDKVIIHYEPHGTVSLLRAAMEDLRFDTPFVLGSISSSVGHSVQRLPFAGVVDIAENAHLAERYLDDIKRRFLTPQTAGYQERLDLFFDISHAEMKRACISQTAAGQLTAQQKAWLEPMIDELWDLEPPIVGGDRTYEKTGIYRLGVLERCVYGAYIFRHLSEDGSQHDLLYTPQAPDGVWFRPLAGVRDAMEASNLGDYFYQRVSYKDQRVITSALLRWKGSQYPAHLIDPALAPHSRVSVWRDEFIEQMQGVVRDVDASTITAAERVSEIFEGLVLNILTIAVAPFPPAAMALNVFTTARSLIRGIQAYQDGDRASAFWHFIDVVHGVSSITTGRDILKETVSKALFKGFAPAAVVRLIDEMDITLTTELTNFLKTQISESD